MALVGNLFHLFRKDDSFSPLQINPSNLAVALDVSAGSNYTDTAGEIDTVANLGTKSGAASSFVVPAANPSVESVSYLANKTALRFDGSENINLSDAAFLDFSTCTVALVYAIHTDAAGTRGMMSKWGTFAGGKGEISCHMSSGGNIQQFVGTPDGDNANNQAANSTVTTVVEVPYLVIGWFTGSAINCYAAGNASENEGTNGALTGVTGFDEEFEIGRTFHGLSMNGFIPELYFWDTDIGSANRELLKAHFKTKYNIDDGT